MSLLCCSKISSQVLISCNTKMYLTSVGPGSFSTIAWPHMVAFRSMNTEISGYLIAIKDNKIRFEWSFLGGLRFLQSHSLQRIVSDPRRSSVSASLLTNPQIASSAFTWGTVAVLPFYTLMILAPKASLTGRIMENNVPYAALGLLYAYLVYLSWTPETLSVIFATKYFLPELPGMTKMFANDMTMASAWIHFLAVDLYAARQVFLDGLKNNIETRHSVIFCLLCCPIGIITHIITKVITKPRNDHH